MQNAEMGKFRTEPENSYWALPEGKEMGDNEAAGLLRAGATFFGG